MTREQALLAARAAMEDRGNGLGADLRASRFFGHATVKAAAGTPNVERVILQAAIFLAAVVLLWVGGLIALIVLLGALAFVASRRGIERMGYRPIRTPLALYGLLLAASFLFFVIDPPG